MYYMLAISGVACLGIALAKLDTQRKRLIADNERLKSEITRRYRYATSIDD
jgi:hypothetical protein